MTVFALISVMGIRNSERLFVNTKLCSCIVRLAQWKNKMVIFDGILGFHVTSQYFPNMDVRHICAPQSVKLYGNVSLL